jgi:4-amino-4-deoxychorismate lyase
VLINGESGDTISAFDRGLQYGDGLFETLAVTAGRPCLWQRHWNRLQHGCERLGIPAPDPHRLYQEALREIGEQDRAVLKIILTRGAGGRGYAPPLDPQPLRIVTCSPWPDYPEKAANEGIVARICAARIPRDPTLAGIKHLNRLPQVMARREWDDPAVAEGLMLDSEDRVIEGTMTNLFLFKGAEIWTPDLSRSGVAGIVRGLLLERLRERGTVVRVTDIDQAELWQADGLFLSNSLIGIWPVRELAGHRFRVDLLDPSLVQEIRERAFGHGTSE